MFYESNLLELCIFKNDVYNYKHIDVNYDVIPRFPTIERKKKSERK